MNPILRWALAIPLMLLLAACVRTPVRLGADAERMAALEAREAWLAQRPDWRLTGRIAVSDGRDGGSGRIEWVQRGDGFSIRLSAPVSRQSWLLVNGPDGARLEGLDDGVVEGSDPVALLYEATGWLIPLESMSRWARGGRGEGPAQVDFDAGGRPSLIRQGGWSVDYRDWMDGPGADLPRRVFAERGDARVRLSVERWEALDEG